MTGATDRIEPEAGEGLRLESGLTGRTWPVILYGALILMPANIYLLLVAGQTLTGPIAFISLILWVEAVRLSRRPLTTAEAFIVYSVSAVAAGQLLFYIYAIHPAYFRISEIANSEMFSFVRDGETVTFAEAAPTWWAPPADVVRKRTFFHSAWLVPIGVGIASWFFHMLADLSMGVLGYYLFVKVEKLPFPFAHPPAEACKALTRGKPEAKKVFTIAGLIGTLWGLLIYLPLTLGKRIAEYPIPWADFNRRLHTVLRGASLGIATDILAFCGGFIIPFRTILSMMIGAFCVQFLGNAWAAGGLGEALGLDPLQWPLLGGLARPELAAEAVAAGEPIPQKAYYFSRFVTGMGIRDMLPNQVFVWMPVMIGAMVSAGLLHILASPRELVRSFVALRSSSRGIAAERTLPLRWLLLAFVASVGGATLLFTILVRVVSGHQFPWWYVAPFALIWSLVFSLIDIRAIGTTGFKIEPPYVRQGMIIAMKPKQIDVWFAPWPIALGAGQWVQNFKTAELTGCTPRSLIIAKLIAYPVGMLASLMFMSIFWSIAPIPSAQYPYTTAQLPVWANQFCIWISASLNFSGAVELNPETRDVMGRIISQVFNVRWMLITAAIFVVLYLWGRVVPKARLSLIGLAVGSVMPIPFAVSLFVGGLVAMWIRRRSGAEWFGRNRNIIVGGLAVGEGVVIGLLAAIAALRSSLIALPY
jgi:hypothetical protein